MQNEGDHSYGPAADIWSLGMSPTCWQCCVKSACCGPFRLGMKHQWLFWVLHVGRLTPCGDIICLSPASHWSCTSHFQNVCILAIWIPMLEVVTICKLPSAMPSCRKDLHGCLGAGKRCPRTALSGHRVSASLSVARHVSRLDMKACNNLVCNAWKP